MKKVLIISPYFPPVNAADMQRIRMSLPYFSAMGWEAEVLIVDPKYSDFPLDAFLQNTVPVNVPVHKVGALPKKYTSKVGLGAIALRALPFLRNAGDRLLATGRFDLVYFSTTQFPVCVLGARWRRKYGIPYVIDMQDPWHSDYYKHKPRSERPAKYWFSYRLNKWLERVAMQKVDGLVSVSQPYLDTLLSRYTRLQQVPQQVITFGAFDKDQEVAQKAASYYPKLLAATSDKINIVYIGRGGRDMQEAISLLFTAFKFGLNKGLPGFTAIHFHFIGTSYAANGNGIPTIQPIAEKLGIGAYVTETTGRIPFYHTLSTLADAHALFVPGSNDTSYTASKIYPYVMAGKPLLSIFHRQSSVVSFLESCGVGTVLTFDMPADSITEAICNFLSMVIAGHKTIKAPNQEVMEAYSAREMTRKQCQLFEAVLA